MFGQPLAQPIVVHVVDQNGASIANAVVKWTVLSGGGSVSAATSQTDANGNASITWTMGPAAFADSLRAAIANGASVIDYGDGAPPVQIVSATGDITAAVNQYRALLGTLNPNVAGEQPGGRREINWDGVPAAFTNNDLFPGNFFNVNSPRGVLFTTPGSAFRISDNGYVDVNADYAGEFNVFSAPKLFAARGSTITDVQFVVAGSNTPALVSGFGSVFADVGLGDFDHHRVLRCRRKPAGDRNGAQAERRSGTLVRRRHVPVADRRTSADHLGQYPDRSCRDGQREQLEGSGTSS